MDRRSPSCYAGAVERGPGLYRPRHNLAAALLYLGHPAEALEQLDIADSLGAANDRAAAVRVEALLAETGWIRGLARSLVRDRSAAEELVQDLWVAALERWLAGLAMEDLGAGPVLLVQGDNDHTVDWRWNLPRYQRLFPGREVVMVPGAGHQLANEAAPTRLSYQRVVSGWFEVSAD